MVHPALTFMEQDHPTVDRSTLHATLAVTDFRYRVVFSSVDGEEVLEVSMDTLISENLQTNMITSEYEVELEIIADAPNDENLEELFRVTKLMEQRYELTPSGRSKGGNYVPDRLPDTNERQLGIDHASGLELDQFTASTRVRGGALKGPPTRQRRLRATV